MREIVVISGKGGTGKTSVCASLAHLAQNKVVCDLDVDAPDMHILLDPQVRAKEAFVSGNEAVIDRDACRRCGVCFTHLGQNLFSSTLSGLLRRFLRVM